MERKKSRILLSPPLLPMQLFLIMISWWTDNVLLTINQVRYSLLTKQIECNKIVGTACQLWITILG